MCQDLPSRLTFEDVLKSPQGQLKKSLSNELSRLGYDVIDQDGFLYAQGDLPVMLVAHLDTVYPNPVETICYSDDGNIIKSPEGIGGDDRAGVWMILQIIQKLNCHVLFCEDEEIGRIGAKKFTSSGIRPIVNYIVELDRRNDNDAVFYDCENEKFIDFITSFGFEEAGGVNSDISDVAPYLEIAAVNISTGFYKAHSTGDPIKEYIDMKVVNKNIGRVIQIIETPSAQFAYM